MLRRSTECQLGEESPRTMTNVCDTGSDIPAEVPTMINVQTVESDKAGQIYLPSKKYQLNSMYNDLKGARKAANQT